VRRDLWRYLTPSADVERELLEAAALLQMPGRELRSLGALQFLISDELGEMLDELPVLLRRLSTTTTSEEEISAERIRGAIQWGRTIGLRHATGSRHLYVTAPTRRAYQTPENELLVFMLDATVSVGRLTGWQRSTSPMLGTTIRDRVSTAARWSQSRMLQEVERRPVGQRTIGRVRMGRHRRRYHTVLAAYDRYNSLVGRLDRATIRRAVEETGLVTRDDPTILELYCTFELLASLRGLGWRLGHFGLFTGSLSLQAQRGEEQLTVTYQAVPRQLAAASHYRTIQRNHSIHPGALRPDLVLMHRTSAGESWLLVEVKGGERTVEQSARAAAYDLLAYRSAFAAALASSPAPYGLGVVWGA
jgi:hypothetical protein